MPFKAVKLYSPAGNIESLLTLTGRSDLRSALTLLAETLVRDSRFLNAVMVVRLQMSGEDHNGIYLFGDFSGEETERVSHLATQIRYTAENSRFISYHNAENLAVILAEKLVRKYGQKQLRNFEFRPVPRGGYIVCGLLLYALGGADRVGSEACPLLLVDDAVFSGYRIRQVVETVDKEEKDREICVAVLAAPEALCTEEAAVRQGFSIIAAEEYADMAPELYGEEHSRWKDIWDKKTSDTALWTGHPEALVFAWSEPENIYINSVSGEIEAGFRLYSAERCFRNRFEGEPGGRIQIHDDSGRRWNAAPGTVAARLADDRIVVADFSSAGEEKTADCFLLEDTAADMWEILLKSENIEAAADTLAAMYEADYEDLRADLEQFAASLLEQGLMRNG